MRREGLRLMLVCGLLSAVATAALAAKPPAGLSIIKGPYLQNVTTDAITIMWQTSAAGDSQVEYGATSGYGVTVYDPTQVTVHEVRLTGLGVDATYHYRASTVATPRRGTPQTVVSPDSTFETAVAPTTTAFRFVAYGDTRSQPAVHAQVVNAIIADAPRFVVHTGDLVASGSKDSYWQTDFFNPAKPMIVNTTVFPIQGNHEGNSAFYYQYFDPPDGGGDYNERWYSFTYGNAKFVGVDTQADFSPGSAQYTWLVSELQSAVSEWLFVFQHYPAYSSGSHGGDANVQAYLVPLYEQYGVDMVFCGHDHIYERSQKSGVQYVVTGGGGAPLYDVNTSPNPYQVYAASLYHHCTIDINGSTASFSAIDNGGVVFDSVALTHAAALAGQKAFASVR